MHYIELCVSIFCRLSFSCYVVTCVYERLTDYCIPLASSMLFLLYMVEDVKQVMRKLVCTVIYETENFPHWHMLIESIWDGL